jgi:hypothetical protein
MVRDQTDEHSQINLSPQQIIDALNRGQRKAANILARRYDEFFWATVEIPTVNAQSTYALPARTYGRRIEKIEVKTQGDSSVLHEVRKISNRDRTPFVTNSTTSRPQYYSQSKNVIELYPKPNGSSILVVHYNTAPEKLVVPQGRITNINTSNPAHYVVVDSLGSQVSTSTTGFNAYVNIIDYVTGAVKGTMQVQSINTAANQIVFKPSALTRTSVLGRTISTALPADTVVDDYICLVTGSCVAEIPDAYQDYLIQYAVLEIRRRFAEPTSEEYAQLKELEQELLKAWAGRESSHRIRKVSPHWGTGAYDRKRRLLSS